MNDAGQFYTNRQEMGCGVHEGQPQREHQRCPTKPSRVAVVFDTVVSSCDFVNCQSVQMQVLVKVNTISVEKTDGCQMFVNKESIGVEIVSAKSSEMNVVIPDGDDIVEQPIPEQFKTTISGKKLITSATESV